MPSSIAGGFRFHQAPESAPIPLRVAPRLTGWDSPRSTSQAGLDAFVEHAEAQLAAWPVAREPLAVRLDVALPASADLFESGALTDYLLPLAQRLGSDRIASMWASKSHAVRESTLRVERAHVIAGPAGEDWSVACVRATGPAALPAWKAGVRDQLAARAGAAPEGPLEMEVAFRAGRGRSWINLWRQAMDSLGPVLGLAKAGQPFHPRGGRVVRLGLHHSLATELGHDVEIAFCWRPAGSRARVWGRR